MEKVMSKIGKTAMKTYRCAAEGAGRIAREIKLRAQMSENKSQIQEIYETIGKQVYEKYLLQEALDIQTDFKDDCAMIDVLANEVEDIRMEILNLKDLKQCPNCHYEIELEYHYCPNCGYEQELTQEAKQNDGPATIETIDETDSSLKKAKPDNKEETVNLKFENSDAKTNEQSEKNTIKEEKDDSLEDY